MISDIILEELDDIDLLSLELDNEKLFDVIKENREKILTWIFIDEDYVLLDNILDMVGHDPEFGSKFIFLMSDYSNFYRKYEKKIPKFYKILLLRSLNTTGIDLSMSIKSPSLTQGDYLLLDIVINLFHVDASKFFNNNYEILDTILDDGKNIRKAINHDNNFIVSLILNWIADGHISSDNTDSYRLIEILLDHGANKNFKSRFYFQTRMYDKKMTPLEYVNKLLKYNVKTFKPGVYENLLKIRELLK